MATAVKNIEIPDVIDVEAMDIDYKGVPNKAFVGKKLRWHDEEELLLVIIKGSLRAAMQMTCQTCETKGPTYYVGGGPHIGAWCYAYDKNGKYLADFRNQSWFCEDCSEKKNKVREERIEQNRLKAQRLSTELSDVLYQLSCDQERELTHVLCDGSTGLAPWLPSPKKELVLF